MLVVRGMEDPVGFEPTTFELKARCTACLCYGSEEPVCHHGSWDVPCFAGRTGMVCSERMSHLVKEERSTRVIRIRLRVRRGCCVSSVDSPTLVHQSGIEPASIGYRPIALPLSYRCG
jgi:hypothetical protein